LVAKATAMNNLFELYEKQGWERHHSEIRDAADALVAATKGAEKFGALDTASRDAILDYVVQEMYRG
jgi:hypothetical protein